jgi:hypothetical protein
MDDPERYFTFVSIFKKLAYLVSEIIKWEFEIIGDNNAWDRSKQPVNIQKAGQTPLLDFAGVVKISWNRFENKQLLALVINM